MAKKKSRTQPKWVASTNEHGEPSIVVNPDENKTVFNEEPNLNKGNNAQGTLFDVVKTPRSTPGHRGFSPARQDAVRNSMSFKVLGGSGLPAKSGTNYTSKSGPGAAREVQDMFSRSDTPLHEKLWDDERLNVMVVPPNHPKLEKYTYDEDGKPKATGGFVNGRFYGGYHSSTTYTSSDTFTRQGPRELLRSMTAFHEDGHNDAYEENMDSSKYNTPERMGVDEAYADDYAVKHTPKVVIPDKVPEDASLELKERHKTAKNTEVPNFRGKYPVGDRGAAFSDAYDVSRTTPMSRHEAAASVADPAIPSSRKVEFSDEAEKNVAAVNAANPTLPGMEDAAKYTAEGVDPKAGQRVPPYWQTPAQFADMTRNRQTEAIRGS